MSSNKVAATFHPHTSYVCEYCGSEHRHPLSAAACCDPAAYGDAD